MSHIHPSGNPAILLTGQPAVGKTTVIRAVLDQLGTDVGGFYTREVRRGSTRIGFEIVSLSGESALLATTALEPRFAREVPFNEYRINLDAVEHTALQALEQARSAKKLILIDEIGPMEIASPRFQTMVLKIIHDPDLLVLGTIVKRPYPFADDVKKMPRVNLIQVTLSNRDRLPDRLLRDLKIYL